MELKVAKEQVLSLIDENIRGKGVSISLSTDSPDRDAGKFVLIGNAARVIQPFNGFFVNINLDWFEGSEDLPKIQGGEFYWYVFALLGDSKNQISDYYICDFMKLRSFVLDFQPRANDDHRDHLDWRGAIEILGNNNGYFRWGGESKELNRNLRYITLNNILEIAESTIIKPYLPSKEDFINAYTKIAKLGDEVKINDILDKIESTAIENGLHLKDNWRYITERNILELWIN